MSADLRGLLKINIVWKNYLLFLFELLSVRGMEFLEKMNGKRVEGIRELGMREVEFLRATSVIPCFRDNYFFFLNLNDRNPKSIKFLKFLL